MGEDRIQKTVGSNQRGVISEQDEEEWHGQAPLVREADHQFLIQLFVLFSNFRHFRRSP